VANDHWLKRAYPGIISGKLSDFAGLAVVGLLLAAALPGRRPVAMLALVTAFAWWKSPLSQSAIDWASAHSGMPIGRTVDVTDLAAAAVLPICGRLADSASLGFAGWRTLRRALALPAGLLAALALMATSLAQTKQEYSVRPVDGRATLDIAHLKNVIDRVAVRHGMELLATSADGALYSGGMSMKYRIGSDSRVTFEVSAVASGGLLFPGTTPGVTLMNALRDDLKRALAGEFPGLEYSELLRPEPPRRPPCNPSPVPSCR
jgi:hypothetical protein